MAIPGSATNTGRAWLYDSIANRLEQSIKLREATPPPPQAQEIRIEVYAASLNPIDYKLPEVPFIGARLTKLPASPGKDFAGRIVGSGSGITGFKTGDRVFGRVGGKPLQYGTLSRFVNVGTASVAKLPEGVSYEHGAAMATAGTTALQSLAQIGSAEGAARGKTVLINGASGGVGTFTVQLAKLFGAKVVATCSGANAQLVRDLGADEVIDYRATNLLQELTKSERSGQFDLIVDNVGTDGLHKTGDVCLKPSGSVVQVGAGMSLSAFVTMAKSALWPTLLGGAKRQWKFLGVSDSRDDLDKLATWAVQGKLKVLVDTAFAFEDAPKAFEKLRTGRARGKIVVTSST